MKSLAMLLASLWVAVAVAQSTPQDPPRTLADVTQGAQTPEQAEAEQAALEAEIEAMSLGELVREGRRLLEAGELDQCRPYVKEAILRDRNAIDVMLLVADVAMAENDVQSARPFYLQVYRIDSNDFRANLGLGKIYLATRVWRQAVNYLEKAERTAPLDEVPEVQRLLSEAYRNGGQVIKAVEVAEKAVAGAPNDYDTRRALTSALIDAERIERAVTAAEALVEIAKRDVQADPADRTALEQLWSARDLLLGALRRAFRDLLETGPAGHKVDQVIPGKEEEGAGLVKRVADTMVLQAETQRLIAYHDVIEMTERAVELDDDNAALWRDHGLLLAQTQQREAAIKALQKALELDPSDQVARQQLQALGATPQAAVEPPVTE